MTAKDPSLKMPESVKIYETDVRTDSDFSEIPHKAQFSVSESQAREIIRFSEFVAQNDLHKVEKFDYRTTWLEGGDQSNAEVARVDLATLNISANEFWFSGYLKHTSVEILSERQQISMLAEWFGIGQADKQVERPKG